MRIGNRVFKRSASETNRARGGMDARNVQLCQRQIETATFLTQQPFGGEAEIVKEQVPRLPSVISDLSDRRSTDPIGESAPFLFYQECADTQMSSRSNDHGFRPGEQRDVVSAIGERAPHLRSADHPFVAVTACIATKAGDVRTGLRLGQCESPQKVSGCRLRKESLLLFDAEP